MSFAEDVESENVEYRCCVDVDLQENGGCVGDYGSEGDLGAGGGGGGANAHVGTINKLFTQELKVIADRDPLHDLTEQVHVILVLLRTSI